MKKKLFGFSALLIIAATIMTACAPSPTVVPAPAATDAPAAPAATEVPPTDAPIVEVVEEGMLPEVDPGSLTGDIYSAGSSTVYPLSEAITLQFRDDGFAGEVKVDSIGSGAGFERFCKTGETDIANASRGIKESEIESCKSINRNPIEFRVGTDALAVVVSMDNDFLTDVSIEELAKIFSSEAVLWSDVNPSYPSEPIQRFVPGTDSGTFDYFVEAVMLPVYGTEDKENAKKVFLEAKNLSQSEDDNVLVQGVNGSQYAIGFFGYAYFSENNDTLKTISINGIEPSADTAESGEYPIARPLFIYSDAEIMKTKPQVAAFINYYLTTVNDVITEVGYFPASEDALKAAKQAWLDANTK